MRAVVLPLSFSPGKEDTLIDMILPRVFPYVELAFNNHDGNMRDLGARLVAHGNFATFVQLREDCIKFISRRSHVYVIFFHLVLSIVKCLSMHGFNDKKKVSEKLMIG